MTRLRRSLILEDLTVLATTERSGYLRRGKVNVAGFEAKLLPSLDGPERWFLDVWPLPPYRDEDLVQLAEQAEGSLNDWLRQRLSLPPGT